MNRQLAALVVLAAMTVTLTSVAAAGPGSTKQRVAIDVKILPRGTFVLTPLQPGALKRDSGTLSGNWQSNPGRDVMRDGQKVTIFAGGVWTLTGKQGTFTIRERNEWVDVGSDVNGDAFPDSVAVGTWKVVRGTGQYAKLAGGGRSGHMGLGQVWTARHEGILTSP